MLILLTVSSRIVWLKCDYLLILMQEKSVGMSMINLNKRDFSTATFIFIYTLSLFFIQLGGYLSSVRFISLYTWINSTLLMYFSRISCLWIYYRCTYVVDFEYENESYYSPFKAIWCRFLCSEKLSLCVFGIWFTKVCRVMGISPGFLLYIYVRLDTDYQ